MSTEKRGGEAVWWAILNHVRGVGAATMLRLVNTFGSPEAAACASEETLVARGGLTPEQAQQLTSLAAVVDEFRERLTAYANRGIQLVALHDPPYPSLLRETRTPPPLLYVQGQLHASDSQAVAIVGTRAPDAEGMEISKHFARQFAARGYAIVSGLARGIDTAGHRGALEVEQGRTLAVLGCGLLRLYPPENVGLVSQVAAHGALLSEVPPETEVDRRLLLARDRIQAGLSRAVIVIQAHHECGSLITARHAVHEHRLLYGVPWKKSPFADGWEKLQQLGARPISPDDDIQEIIAEIESKPTSATQPPLL